MSAMRFFQEISTCTTRTTASGIFNPMRLSGEASHEAPAKAVQFVSFWDRSDSLNFAGGHANEEQV